MAEFADAQRPPRFGCNQCGGECNLEALGLRTETTAWLAYGDQYFGPECDADWAAVPPALTALAVFLRAVEADVVSGTLPTTPVERPPRLRLSAMSVEDGLAEPVDPETIAAAADWPIPEVSLAELVAGPKVFDWWGEVSLTGDLAARVWGECRPRVVAGTKAAGPGVFLAREGETVFAVACAVDLPGEPWLR